MDNTRRTRTPCVGTCSTTFGDRVCRGCKRFVHEVYHWNQYAVDDKITVINRLEALIAEVVSDYLIIKNSAQLAQALKQMGVKFNDALTPPSWLHRLATHPMPSTLTYATLGIAPKPAYKKMPIQVLIKTIDRQFFERSEAWFERSFKSPSSPEVSKE